MKGFAYQTLVNNTVNYNKDYFDKYVKMENTTIAKKLNTFRTSITKKYCKNLLDIGIGSGEFIKNSKIKVYGYDINPYGIEWLNAKSLFLDPYKQKINHIEGLTFWDSLEHFYEPSELLNKLKKGQYIFISLPIFDNIMQIKKSKHYRPDEHLSYFTCEGFILFLEKLNFDVVEISSEEIKSGRTDILTFVACKQK